MNATFTETVGFVDLGRRTLIEMTGADRASFLQGICTNDRAPAARCS